LRRCSRFWYEEEKEELQNSQHKNTEGYSAVKGCKGSDFADFKEEWVGDE